MLSLARLHPSRCRKALEHLDSLPQLWLIPSIRVTVGNDGSARARCTPTSLGSGHGLETNVRASIALHPTRQIFKEKKNPVLSIVIEGSYSRLLEVVTLLDLMPFEAKSSFSPARKENVNTKKDGSLISSMRLIQGGYFARCTCC